MSKLDIFPVLTAFDQKQLGLREALEDDPDMAAEFDKSIDWLLPVWMTGADREMTHREIILAFDELNNKWGHLRGMPHAQANLLATCGTGRSVRHKFFKPASKPKRDALQDFLKLDDADYDAFVKSTEPEELKDMLFAMGLQDGDWEDHLKEFKKRKPLQGSCKRKGGK